MPNGSSERRVVRQTRMAVELTKQAASDIAECVKRSRALVAESRLLLQKTVHYRPGHLQNDEPPPNTQRRQSGI